MNKNKQVIFQSVLLDGLIFTFVVLSLLVYFVNPSEDQLLMLSRNTFLSLGVFAFSGVVVFLLNSKGIHTIGHILFAEPQLSEAVQEDVPWFKKFWGIELIVAFIIAFYASFVVTEFSFYELFSESGFLGAQRIFSSLLNPNFEILPRAILAIIETIFMAFMATVLAVPIAFVLSFLCAKNVMSGHKVLFAIYGTIRTLLNVTRSIEPLIWAIIFSVWVGIGPFAGMLALLLHSVASLAKNYSELVECISEGPVEAIKATGASSLQVVWFAMVPQIVLPYTAFTIYRWDINVRMATIIGLVGGGGIGTMLIQYQGQALWNEVGCLVLVIAVVVWVMDTGSAYIREAIK
ncbi:MAG: phosphonate ABC transporter, permease protein PhnE [Bdellovibrionaceae bacterium]|jgi:phosphonate transport system permease protein|nr:phosphonate ABC transporter, permease protein PhnE [Pseudobdellovibrionaceae bacterium]